MFSFLFGRDGFGGLLPAVHGGSHGEADGGLVGMLDRFLETLSGGGGPDPTTSWRMFGGIEALGSNIHPLIVHFPIAFLSAFLLLEVLGLGLRNPAVRQVASGMLYLGAFSAIAAAGAGLLAEATVPHGAEVHEIMEWHERAWLTVAGLSVIMAVWRAVSRARFSAMAQALHLFVAALISVCLVFGADLGGLMVYQHGVGVKSLQETAAIHHHHHHPEDEGAQAEEDGTTGQH